MSPTVAATFLNALTVQALADLWSNAFGISTPVADTAALVLAPTNLLSGKPLSSYLLSDLTLDPNSYTPMTGLYTVEQAGDTGLIVAGFSVELPVTPNSNPVGAALFVKGSSRLWYLSAFSPWPQPLPSAWTWDAKITLGTTQGC